jgi:hypothetical protein
MNREVHVRICGSPGVRFPRATQPGNPNATGLPDTTSTTVNWLSRTARRFPERLPLRRITRKFKVGPTCNKAGRGHFRVRRARNSLPGKGFAAPISRAAATNSSKRIQVPRLRGPDGDERYIGAPDWDSAWYSAAICIG